MLCRCFLLLVLFSVYAFAANTQAGVPSLLNSSFLVNDELILNKKEISQYNRLIYARGYLVHPTFLGSILSGKLVKKWITADVNQMRKYYKYSRDNVRQRDPKFVNMLARICAANNVPEQIRTRYALSVKPCYLRRFPTDMIILKKTNDMPFDLFQQASFDAGNTFAVMHESEDKKWVYVQAYYIRGWLRTEALAWTDDKKIIQKFRNPGKRCIIMDWKIPVYKSKSMKEIYSHIRMGGVLPLLQAGPDYYQVQFPLREADNTLTFTSAWIRKDEDVATEYLPMTSKNIDGQCAKMLGVPYGWGGLDFNTDCSSFLRRVFLCMGLEFPRSSVLQSKLLHSKRLHKGSVKKNISACRPFETLLYTPGPGHIMLYIGTINNEPYVVHNIWSYNVRDGSRDREVIVGKTLVSDLNMGVGSYKGARWRRVSRISGFR